MRARNRARRSAHIHSHGAPMRAPLCAAPRARIALPRAPLRAPLRAHALNAAAVRICRSVPCCLWKGGKVCDRTCLGWDPNSPVPPLPPTPLWQGWLAEGDAVPAFQAGSSTGASCDRSLGPVVWPAHVGPRLPARPTAAVGPAGPRRLPARPARGGCRNSAVRLARGGCRHGRPAVAAGTPGPRRLPALPGRLSCRHGRPAAVAGTACPRRLHENGSGNA